MMNEACVEFFKSENCSSLTYCKGLAFTTKPYGDSWCARRRVFASEFDTNRFNDSIPIRLQHWRATVDSAECQRPLTTGGVISGSELKSGLLTSKIIHCLFSMVTAGMMDVIYGIEVPPKNHPYIDMAVEKGMQSVAESLLPGNFLVD